MLFKWLFFHTIILPYFNWWVLTIGRYCGRITLYLGENMKRKREFDSIDAILKERKKASVISKVSIAGIVVSGICALASLIHLLDLSDDVGRIRRDFVNSDEYKTAVTESIEQAIKNDEIDKIADIVSEENALSILKNSSSVYRYEYENVSNLQNTFAYINISSNVVLGTSVVLAGLYLKEKKDIDECLEDRNVEVALVR